MLIDHSDEPRALRFSPVQPPTTDVRTSPATVIPANDDERRLDFDLLGFWRVISKRRWIIVTTVIVALVVGAAATLTMQPIFTAKSTLQIDREAQQITPVAELAIHDQQVSSEEFFLTQYGLLRSRALAERVAQTQGLTRNGDFIRAMNGNMSAASEPNRRRDEVVQLLQHNLVITPTRGSRLVSVQFQSPVPALSARVSNAFAENFITSNLDRRFEASSYARDFLQRRLEQTRTRLEQSERQLVAYAAQQRIVRLNDNGGADNPGQERSLAAASLEQLNSSLAEARVARIQAEQQWIQARSRGMAVSQVLSSPTIQNLTATRARLAADYQQRLATYLPEYPEMVQLRAQIAETDRQIAAESSNIRSSLRSNYDAALQNERQLQGQVSGLQNQVLDLRNRSIQYTILQREVDTNRSLYDGLLQRYREVGVAGGVTTNNISIVDRAQVPLLPSSPRPVLNMGLAAIGGLLLGVVLAFGREALDQLIRVPADVETELKVPVLGTVPMLARGTTPAEALADNRSPLAEAYHSLRSALQFSTEDGFPASMLVTSTRQGEGKSTTAQAIALNIARLGFRTLLVDGDLRNPSLHKSLGLDNRTGLSNVLTGAATLEHVVQAGGAPNLSVVTCGPLPPNPAELLASQRLRTFLDEAQGSFDIVILDGPPVMGLADAPMIASNVSGVLLVIEASKTGKVQATSALRRLQMGRGRVLGATLTKFDARAASYGYGYAYEYEYDYGKTRSKGGRALDTLASRARRLVSPK